MVRQSVLHFVKDCPHTRFMTEAEECALFTGKNNNDVTVLLTEAANSAILDTACFSIVPGKD